MSQNNSKIALTCLEQEHPDIWILLNGHQYIPRKTWNIFSNYFLKGIKMRCFYNGSTININHNKEVNSWVATIGGMPLHAGNDKAACFRALKAYRKTSWFKVKRVHF